MKIIFLILLLSSIFSNQYAEDVSRIIDKVQNKYKKVDAIHLDFKQVNRFKLTGLTNEIYGTLWMTDDDKFKLDTEDQTMISNGETYWRVNKLENQVLIDHAKKSDQDVFMQDFLFDIDAKYYSQILSEQKIDGKTVYEIRLTPKVPESSFFTFIKIWITDGSWDVRKVVYVDYDENESEYVIEKFNINPDISENQFQFEVPNGLEVIDLRF